MFAFILILFLLWLSFRIGIGLFKVFLFLFLVMMCALFFTYLVMPLIIMGIMASLVWSLISQR